MEHTTLFISVETLILVALEIVEEMEECLLNIKQRKAANKNTTNMESLFSTK